MKYIYCFTLIIIALSLSFTSCQQKNQNEISENNDVVENILSRRSVRTYTDQKVEKEKIETMLRAGMAAPSGKDTRPWEFMIIDDRSLLDSLASRLPSAKMLKHTPQALIVCGDSARSFYWYLDCSAAAQNILLTAHSLGLGAVWTAAYPYEDWIQAVNNVIDLPENIFPLCVIPFGYPAGKEKPKDKYDASKIHYNGY